ncbi:hypothetical protein EDD86DRAFT_256011 [Gorgonomyces haynaldii]|nr:hypothetical protein EDD86DRAFT_256011 [Gorgonomyces haynaldii]
MERQQLLENYTKREQEYQEWFETTEGVQVDQLAQLMTVRKDRMFDSETTPEEQEIIRMRVELQQLKFKEFEAREQSRKIAKVRHMFRYLTAEEIKIALEEVNWDEEEAIVKFTNPEYLSQIRKKIASTYVQQAYERLLERRKKRSIRYVRLKLDEALQQLENGTDPEKVFEGWSAARTRAYQQIHTKPNSYYYRFNAPGEKQEHGPWSQREKELFLERLNQVGADGQWGIFSMTIPGRCSNFYRHLLKTGEIVDKNYHVDEKGELHYLFGKKEGGKGTVRTYNRESKPKDEKPKKPRQPRQTQKKKRKRNEWDDNKEDGNFMCSVKETEDIEYDDNPLSGFIDPITLEPVVKPAISPYGHVMGYDSWVRCLGSKNICPITKKPLSKREIVLLTLDNIADYVERIVNK